MEERINERRAEWESRVELGSSPEDLKNADEVNERLLNRDMGEITQNSLERISDNVSTEQAQHNL